jgi:two-component system sensor histidine kinase KdpD
VLRRLREREVAVFFGGAATIAAATAGLRQVPHANPTTAALVLLLVVLAAATLARLRTAIALSALAMLAFNFYFLPPVGTFTIAGAQNWIAWLAFLVVAVIASKLSAAAQERAREATKADLAASLLASLSHDLRTPLTAVRVAVENLRGELPDDQRRAQAHAAMSELERLTRLLRDILDMARIDAEAVRLERQWVTAADVVDAAIAHVRHAVDGHAVRVEADTAMEVEIDPRLASVALSHVIENAAHYSPRDRPILVDARTERDGLHVSVTDQGAGVDTRDVEHLFDRFYRGRQRAAAPSGTGMGLAITRGLLAAAGGKIWLDSAPGTGARFALVVPGSTRAAIT